MNAATLQVGSLAALLWLAPMLALGDVAAPGAVPATQSAAARARRIEATGTRLCERHQGEARRACRRQFGDEVQALGRFTHETPPAVPDLTR